MQDNGDDDLSMQQLHELLEGASKEASEGDPVAIEMLSVITGMVDRRLGVPASARTAPAAVVVMMRVCARRLNAAIGDALGAALSVRNGDFGPDPERALAPASAIGNALGRVHGLLRDLGPDFDLGLDIDRSLSLVQELTGTLARSASFDAGRARDLLAALLTNLGNARHRTLELALALGFVPVDASGADLSGIEIGHLAPLHGVTWTRETTWPPGLASRVQPYSEEARPGVYRIRIPYASH